MLNLLCGHANKTLICKTIQLKDTALLNLSWTRFRSYHPSSSSLFSNALAYM